MNKIIDDFVYDYSDQIIIFLVFLGVVVVILYLKELIDDYKRKKEILKLIFWQNLLI